MNNYTFINYNMSNFLDNLNIIIDNCLDSLESFLDSMFPCCRICRKCRLGYRYHINDQCPVKRRDMMSCRATQSTVSNITRDSFDQPIHKHLGELLESELICNMTSNVESYNISTKHNITTDHMLESEHETDTESESDNRDLLDALPEFVTYEQYLEHTTDQESKIIQHTLSSQDYDKDAKSNIVESDLEAWSEISTNNN